MIRKKSRIRRWCLRLFLAGVLGVILASTLVILSTRHLIKETPADVATVTTGLVLGTSKSVEDGRPNLFFAGRIAAAAELYKAGKIRNLLLSGDHQSDDYNEPADMQRALVALGVPASAMTQDGAGLRTLDSVVRARENFGVKECVIITDDFHLPRALYLAKHFGLNATGYSSTGVDWGQSFRTRVREYFARIKMLLDLHLLDTRPQTSP